MEKLNKRANTNVLTYGSKMRRTAQKIPVRKNRDFLSIAKAMVYHQQWQNCHCCISLVRQDCISSRFSVYQKNFRNDDIQRLPPLMICNSYGIDDIQGLRLDFLQNFIV